MEDYELDLVIGQGPSARSVKVPLQKFTLIGATTRAGLLTAPLRARFGIVHRLDFYQDRERVIREAIADLRAAWAAHPDDAALADLIGELTSGSAEFARFWELRDVSQSSNTSRTASAIRTGEGLPTRAVSRPDPAATAPQKKSVAVPPSADPAGTVKLLSRHSSRAQAIGCLHCVFVLGPVGPL